MFFIAGGIIASFLTFVGVILFFFFEMEEIRIPFVDRYYEWQEAREAREFNKNLIEQHRKIYGQEPLIEWKD